MSEELRAHLRALAVGDVVRLRKLHPCGSSDFRVLRVGADVGLRCLGCDHRIMLDRNEFERRTKAFVSRNSDVVAAE